MGNVSTMDISRSPFVRAHRESFAAVAAAVARRMAVHCNRRRKTGWVDGLVGYRTSWPFTPLAQAFRSSMAGRALIVPFGFALARR